MIIFLIQCTMMHVYVYVCS